MILLHLLNSKLKMLKKDNKPKKADGSKSNIPV